MLSRRLCLELTADQGLPVAHEVALAMAELIPGFEVSKEEEFYRSRVMRVKQPLSDG